MLKGGASLKDVAETLGRSVAAVKNRLLKPYRPDARKFKRKCHDCGKPCNDYRCPECWAKLRHSGGYDSLDTAGDVETSRPVTYIHGYGKE